MKRLLSAFAYVLAVAVVVCAQQQMDEMHKPSVSESASLMSGLGALHHPVSTKSTEAQRFFDQGLTLVYAFNHEEAIRSFRRAAELDPQMAMAYWGIAYALGPNINLDVDPEREQAAYDAAQQALKLATHAPEQERAYIEALALRYANDPKADLKKLAVAYKNAMGALVKRFPDDLDAATLYAESAMDLRPWQLWMADGKPAEGTEEIIAVLESVLKRNPNHIGAIHYYIHAVEASPHPERALPYVAKLPAQVPAAGHLVHMPAHIYERTGDYAAAAQSNRDAAHADEAYFKVHGTQGIYPAMYYNHNLHFECVAETMSGRYTEAIAAARQLEANVAPAVRLMPMLESFMPTPTLVLVRFRRWAEIMKVPQPARELPITVALWHFARGVADAANNRLQDADNEQRAFADVVKTIPADASFGLNSAQSILHIAGAVLGARIALAKQDNKAGIALLRQAVEAEDALAYDEPPAWFIPTRESLGGALLRAGQAAEAEQIFRADLVQHPHSGRSLFGLRESLKAQGKTREAQQVEQEFARAWQHADTQLNVADL
jgi:tetratricopeptide (TPR) repeat protein